MSEIPTFMRHPQAAAKLADLLVISLADAKERLAPPTAYFGDTPAWAVDALHRADGNGEPVRYLVRTEIPALAGLKLATLAKYSAEGRFVEPDAALLPTKTYGWLQPTIETWLRKRSSAHEDRPGRPSGSRTQSVEVASSTIKYLTASEAADELGVSRSTVTARLRDGEFPPHDALIGSHRVWLPATITAYRHGVRTAATGEPKRYLSPPELAELLQISDVAVRAAISKRRIPPPSAIAGVRAGWTEGAAAAITQEWRRP